MAVHDAAIGEVGTVTEWMFDSAAFDPSTAGWVVARYYAWSAPIFDGWVHDDGTIKRFMVPIPENKLWAQPTESCQIVFGKDAGIE